MLASREHQVDAKRRTAAPYPVRPTARAVRLLNESICSAPTFSGEEVRDAFHRQGGHDTKRQISKHIPDLEGIPFDDEEGLAA